MKNSISTIIINAGCFLSLLLLVPELCAQDRPSANDFSVSRPLLPPKVRQFRIELHLPEDDTAAILNYSEMGRKKRGEYANAFVRRAEEILKSNLLPDDKEFRIYFWYTLGMNYVRLDRWEKAEQCLEEAQKIGPAEQPEMRSFTIATDLVLRVVYLKRNKFTEAYPISKRIIEEYQGAGTGLLKNHLAAGEVSTYRLIASRIGVSEAEITRYLASLSERFDNEVGCAADVELLKSAQEKKDQKSISELKARIRDRYPRTWSFKILYQNIITE